MAPERYLLDSSALLTLIEDEPGSERVEDGAVLLHKDPEFQSLAGRIVIEPPL